MSRDTSSVSNEFVNHENLDQFGLDNVQLSSFLNNLENHNKELIRIVFVIPLL